MWVTTIIERAMKGDLHPFSCMHQLAEWLHIDVSLGGKRSKHDSIGP